MLIGEERGQMSDMSLCPPGWSSFSLLPGRMDGSSS